MSDETSLMCCGVEMRILCAHDRMCMQCGKTRENDTDRIDQYSAQIDAAHPLKTGAHEDFAVAIDMVANRYTKSALVDLVNWLLYRINQAKALQESAETQALYLVEQRGTLIHRQVELLETLESWFLMPGEPHPSAAAGWVAEIRQVLGRGKPDGV